MESDIIAFWIVKLSLRIIKVSSKDEVLKLIYSCVEDLNRQLPEKIRLVSNEATSLIGDETTLDSLALVTLIVSIEEKIKSELNISAELIVIASTQYENEHPFETIGSMSDWIVKTSSIAE